MKYCNEVGKVEYPQVKAGETVNIRDNGYYLVCSTMDELRLVKLETGYPWSYSSLWGDLDPKRITKVDLCFKEC